MAEIFISYRRQDTRADAGRLYDLLSSRFGHENVFMDVDDIAPGENFVDRLDHKIRSCAALVAMIGPNWLHCKRESGARRLEDKGDFVSLEIKAALDRDIPIFPVLLGGAPMPSVEELPDDLASLAQRQAIEIRHAAFHADAEPLIDSLERTIRESRPGSRRWIWLLPILATVGIVLVALRIFGADQEANGGARHGAQQSDEDPDGHPSIALRSAGRILSVDESKAMLVQYDFYHASWNAAGKGIEARYEQSLSDGKPVIADRATNLMWQKGGSSKAMTHELALAYMVQMNEENHAGFNDWRLPTLEEAMSLMQVEPHDAMHINPMFEARAAPIMLTSDLAPPRRKDPGVWIVYFLDGICVPESIQFNSQVRAVRTMPR